FSLTRGPVSPSLLPAFRGEHFQARGRGRGLIEYGSAFYDYFHVALGHARAIEAALPGDSPVPVTIALLCDGFPNGGAYRVGDVRPRLEEARGRGVRFKVVAFTQAQYRYAMLQFRDSLGLTHEELEVVGYSEAAPDGQSICFGFDSLSGLALGGP